MNIKLLTEFGVPKEGVQTRLSPCMSKMPIFNYLCIISEGAWLSIENNSSMGIQCPGDLFSYEISKP